MALNVSQLTDFVTNTIPFYKRKKWVDLSLTKQRHVVVSQLFQKQKVDYRGGTLIQEQVQVRNAGTFTPSGMYGKVNSKIVDHMKTVQIPWTASYVHWSYEVDEDAFQSAPERILRTIDVRFHSMWNDYFDGLENQLWGTAPGPDAEPLEMFGIMDWLQKPSTNTQAFGFNGGNPANYSSGIGGLDSNTYDQWKNGNFGYSQVSQGDLLDKMAEACDKCYFMPPHDYNALAGGKPDYMIYCTYPTMQEFHHILTASNDNLEIDLGKYRGNVLFKGSPIEHVPALTNTDSPVYDVTRPVIGINWNDFEMVYKSGADRKDLPVVIPELQPTVRRHYVKSWYNLLCKNRRGSWIGSNPSLAS